MENVENKYNKLSKGKKNKWKKKNVFWNVFFFKYLELKIFPDEKRLHEKWKLKKRLVVVVVVVVCTTPYEMGE